MKFKKVEIQAFRAYNEVSDGTFDFNIGNDESADLVGIYAPNGFGKTSFYDAVEWGVTKNIHRLLKKHKFNIEHAKSERNINSKTKQYILRNRFAKDETPGYVQLYTTNFTKPLRRAIDVPKKGGVDYKFKDSDTVNRYFQKVILSQEWIDAFLKEDDAADRYNTFMEYFGNQKLDQYRKKIVELLTANEKQIDDLKEKLKGVQKELDFEGDKNILKNINEKIAALQSVYPRLQLIEAEFTESDFVNFKNQLTELLQENQNRGAVAQALLDKQIIALNGDEQRLGLDRFEQTQKEILSLQEQIKRIDDLLKDFQSRTTISNQIAKNLEEQAALVLRQKEITDLIQKMPSYLELLQQRQAHEKETKDKQKELQDKTKALEDARLRLNEIELLQAAQQKAQSDIDLQLRTSAELRQQQAEQATELGQLNTQAEILAGQIKDSSTKINEQQQTVDRLDAVLKEINQDQFPSSEQESYRQFAELLQNLDTQKSERNRLQQAVSELTEAIKERQTFSQEIQRFITLGAEIVNKDQLTVCPLCSHDHKEYEILSRQIASNNLLSTAIQGLMIQKTDLEQLAGQNDTSFKAHKSQLIKRLIEERQAAEKSRNEVRISREEMTLALKTITNRIELIHSAQQRFAILLGEMTYDAYRANIQNKLGEIKKQLNTLNGQINTENTEISNILLEIDTINANLKSLSDSIARISANELFREIVQFFLGNYPGEAPDQTVLEQALKEVNRSIELLKALPIDLKINQKQLENRLKVYQADQLRADRSRLAEQEKQLQQQVKRFEYFVKNDCKVELLTKTTLEAAIASLRENLGKNVILGDDLKLVQQQLENVLPFLQFERARLSFEEIKARLSFLENTVHKELDKERKRVGEHLHDEIKAFFYEELINELYAKIDPHPEYRKIKFMCDFKEDKPKLNVCVCKEGRDELLIPNLYFSTAQLNILSLSIFLAKALNVQDDQQKPVDCIFIDDPIQSMDSINILSTIDLLRSLVVNYKKQIIISTHDENFFNLLQKKIPAGLFKSKFIELETFGKVKQVS